MYIHKLCALVHTLQLLVKKKMEGQSRLRKYRKLFCPHCNKSVSKSTWYSHYSEFFDQARNEWHSCGHQDRQVDDFNFESSDSECDVGAEGYEIGDSCMEYECEDSETTGSTLQEDSEVANAT